METAAVDAERPPLSAPLQDVRGAGYDFVSMTCSYDDRLFGSAGGSPNVIDLPSCLVNCIGDRGIHIGWSRSASRDRRRGQHGADGQYGLRLQRPGGAPAARRPASRVSAKLCAEPTDMLAIAPQPRTRAAGSCMLECPSRTPERGLSSGDGNLPGRDGLSRTTGRHFETPISR